MNFQNNEKQQTKIKVRHRVKYNKFFKLSLSINEFIYEKVVLSATLSIICCLTFTTLIVILCFVINIIRKLNGDDDSDRDSSDEFDDEFKCE